MQTVINQILSLGKSIKDFAIGLLNLIGKLNLDIFVKNRREFNTIEFL